MTLYYVRSDNSDLGGGADFNRRLSGTISGNVAQSFSIAANATETSFAYTDAGIPGVDGANGDFVLGVAIGTANTAIRLSVSVSRVNSGGAVQATSAATGEVITGTASADLVFTLPGVNLGTWQAGDRLRANYILRNTNTMSGQSVGFRFGVPTFYVDAPSGGEELTPVSNDQTGSYSIVGAVGQNLSGAYGISVEVNSDLSGAYEILGGLSAVGADLEGSYATLEAVSRDQAGSYAILEGDDLSVDLYFVASVSGSVSTPANALGAPDGIYTTDGNANTSWTHRWRLGTVAGNNTAIGTHSVTLRVRKGSNTGNPSITAVRLYQADALLGAILPSTYSVTSTAGEDVECLFDSALLDGLADVDVEVVTSGVGGSGTNRNAVEIDAATWHAVYEEAAAPEPVSNDLAGAYAISNAVSSDQPGEYSTVAVVGSESAGSYAILQTVQSDRSGSYVTAEVVGSGYTGSYAVAAAVGQDQPGAYGIAGTVSADRSGAYAVIESVQADRSGSYAIAQAVGADRSGAYGVLQAITSDQSGSYATVAAVGEDRAGTYSVQASVSADRSGDYAIAEGVSADLPGSYAVEAVGTVGSNLEGGYAIEAVVDVGNTYAGSYAVLQSVGADLSGAFGVIDTVSVDHDGSYTVFQVVSQDQPGAYSTLVLVNQDIVLSYAIGGSVQADMAGNYFVDGQPDVLPPASSGTARFIPFTPVPAKRRRKRRDLDLIFLGH